MLVRASDRLALVRGATSWFGATNGDLDVGGDERHGLFDHDCRILHKHVLTIDGARLDGASCDVADGHRVFVRGRMTIDGGDAAGPRLPSDAVAVSIARKLDRGLVERVVVENRTMIARSVRVRLDVAADFLDAMTVNGGVPFEPVVNTVVHGDDHAIVFEATFQWNDRVHRRATRVQFRGGGAALRIDEHGASLTAFLAPQGSVSFGVIVSSSIDGVERAPAEEDIDVEDDEDRAARAWRSRRCRVAGAGGIDVTIARSADDLFALRREGGTLTAFVPQAGLPAYTGLFARDALIAGWHGALLGPEILRGALDEVASFVGTRNDAFRDEEPHKLVHEVRTGPLSVLGVVPQSAYYGTITAPSLFVVALRVAYAWTGDAALLERHWSVAERALAWLRERGDADGDGFVEYETHSPRGLANQGWKDSADAIRHADGSLALAPLAVVDAQARWYEALIAWAELCAFTHDDDGERAARERAARLKSDIDRVFWMDDEATYAMALDRDKRLVRTVGSNAVQLLSAGAVPDDKVDRLVARLFADDMDSGFGVRTLSASHPSYNPYAYHLGCVWPVDAAALIRGLKRAGRDDDARRVADDLFAVAAAFEGHRLPEVYAGHARGAFGSAPATYPRACSPQAWSASSVISALTTLLGVTPDAPHARLRFVRPELPSGVDALVLDGVCVGDKRARVRVRRVDRRCVVDVIDAGGLDILVDDGADHTEQPAHP